MEYESAEAKANGSSVHYLTSEFSESHEAISATESQAGRRCDWSLAYPLCFRENEVELSQSTTVKQSKTPVHF